MRLRGDAVDLTEQTPSVNRYVAETLIYAALLTLVASRALQRALHARWKVDPWSWPLDRWGVLAAAVAQQLLAWLRGGYSAG